jgi:CRP/FNR family cyclic AMP-dependent transcriptional regulator
MLRQNHHGSVPDCMNNFFWSNIFRDGDEQVEIIARLWSDTPLFNNIPTRHVRQLAQNMHVRQYQPNEIIFREGDQGAGTILVLDGEVRIMARDNQLALMQRGDFFGEIALAENDKRTADAICMSEAKLVFFLRQDLEEWIDTEPRLGSIFLMNLASVLAQRLHQANQLLAQGHA